MTILVDMDDTIENLSDAWLKVLNQKFNTNITRQDVRTWSIREMFPSATREEVYGCLDDPEFWKDVTPREDALEVLPKLIEQGHEIYIVTASSYKSIEAKVENVLFKYFPYIDWNHVIITRNKKMITGDVLVDDGPHNLVGGNFAKILINQPYNEDFNELSCGATRVNNWYEAMEYINSLRNNRACIGVRKSDKKVRNDVFNGDEI